MWNVSLWRADLFDYYLKVAPASPKAELQSANPQIHLAYLFKIVVEKARVANALTEGWD